jgi:hypothetical protein
MYSIRGPDFEIRKISIYFIFAKLFKFFDESWLLAVSESLLYATAGFTIAAVD